MLTNYILKFITGEQTEITKQEFKAILNAKDNATIGIKRLGMMIQKNKVQIFPKNFLNEINRDNQKTGICHDGTIIKKHFGQWVVDGKEMPNDKGNYSPVKLDLRYYPEVALDKVATPKEFIKFQQNKIDYYKALGITRDNIKRLNNKKGFVKI